MERILKFRVWDAENKKILSWSEIWHSVVLLPREHLDGFNKDVYFPFISLAIQSPETKYIVQQFTGYKDNNNKEIYEGDIVKTDPAHITNLLRFDENPVYTKGEIMWLCGGFKVGQSGIGATWLGNFVACHCCPCGLEIIGNVLENPELLEETKI